MAITAANQTAVFDLTLIFVLLHAEIDENIYRLIRMEAAESLSGSFLFAPLFIS
jgi:hypothetical protein